MWQYRLNRQVQTVTWLSSIVCPLLSKTFLAHFPVQKTFDWSGKTVIGYNRGFFPIFFGNFYSPISPISVQCPKYRHIAKWIDAFVHLWYWVRIPDCYCVHLTVVNEKGKTTSFLRRKTNGEAHNVCTGSIPSFASIWYFLLLQFSCLRSCKVWVWVNLSRICLFKFYLVLHRVDRAKMSLSHALDLCKLIKELSLNVEF